MFYNFVCTLLILPTATTHNDDDFKISVNVTNIFSNYYVYIVCDKAFKRSKNK